MISTSFWIQGLFLWPPSALLIVHQFIQLSGLFWLSQHIALQAVVLWCVCVIFCLLCPCKRLANFLIGWAASIFCGSCLCRHYNRAMFISMLWNSPPADFFRSNWVRYNLHHSTLAETHTHREYAFQQEETPAGVFSVGFKTKFCWQHSTFNVVVQNLEGVLCFHVALSPAAFKVASLNNLQTPLLKAKGSICFLYTAIRPCLETKRSICIAPVRAQKTHWTFLDYCWKTLPRPANDTKLLDVESHHSCSSWHNCDIRVSHRVTKMIPQIDVYIEFSIDTPLVPVLIINTFDFQIHTVCCIIQVS